jgi:hypothetical protein
MSLSHFFNLNITTYQDVCKETAKNDFLNRVCEMKVIERSDLHLANKIIIYDDLKKYIA